MQPEQPSERSKNDKRKNCPLSQKSGNYIIEISTKCSNSADLALPSAVVRRSCPSFQPLSTEIPETWIGVDHPQCLPLFTETPASGPNSSPATKNPTSLLSSTSHTDHDIDDRHMEKCERPEYTQHVYLPFFWIPLVESLLFSSSTMSKHPRSTLVQYIFHKSRVLTWRRAQRRLLPPRCGKRAHAQRLARRREWLAGRWEGCKMRVSYSILTYMGAAYAVTTFYSAWRPANYISIRGNTTSWLAPSKYQAVSVASKLAVLRHVMPTHIAC